MKKKNLYIASAIILAIALTASMLILLQGYLYKSSDQNLSTVDYSTMYSTISTFFQRKTFWANGNYWLFYDNGTTLFYTNSSDGTSWATPTPIQSAASSSIMSIWSANNKVYYASADGATVVYRDGQTVGDKLVWNNQQTIFQREENSEVYNAFVTVDSSGRPWVSFMLFRNNVENGWTVQVARADSNDGNSWEPLTQISSQSFYPLRPCILPLSGERIYAVYFSKNGAEGRLWDGTEWQQPETITNRTAVDDPGYSAVVLDDEVHLAFLENPTNNIYHYKRSASGEWTEELIEPEQYRHSFPVLSLDSSEKILYLFWVQNTTLQSRKMVNEQWEKVTVPSLNLKNLVAVSAPYEVRGGKLGLALLEAMMPFPPELYKLRYFVMPNL